MVKPGKMQHAPDSEYGCLNPEVVNNKKSKHKLRKGMLRTDTLLLNREDVTLLLKAANPGTESSFQTTYESQL
jgi:hypothetical protein